MSDRKTMLKIRTLAEAIDDLIKELGGDTFCIRTGKDYLWIDVYDKNSDQIVDYHETIKITKKEEHNG